MKRIFSLAAVVIAFGTLAATGGPAFAEKCHDTANGYVCAGARGAGGGGSPSFAGAYGYNPDYFESGHGGGCGYHFEFPNKYVGQC